MIWNYRVGFRKECYSIVDNNDHSKVDWNEVVSQFEAIGWAWGGKFRTFKDYPHCEKSFGYKPSQLFKMKVGVDGYVIIP